MSDLTPQGFIEDVERTRDFSNSEDLTYLDRNGNPRRTIAGINAQFDAMQSGELTAQAVDAADRAETAADVAMAAGWIYTTVSAGEAARVDGDYFWVVSADDSEVLELWLMDGTTATDTGKRTISKGYADEILMQTLINTNFIVNQGAAVNTSNNPGNPIAPGADRAYVNWVDVSSASEIYVTGSNDPEPAWVWVFYDESWNWLGKTDSTGNGSFTVPENAKWAGRTVKVGATEDNLETLEIYISVRDGLANHLTSRIDRIDHIVSAEKYDFDVIQGELVSTNEAFANILVNSDYSRLGWIDVSAVSKILVSGDGRGSNYGEWNWRFVDEDMDFVAFSSTTGNGEHTVPDGAKWAARTINSTDWNLDLSSLEITLYYKDSLISQLQSEIESVNSRLLEQTDLLHDFVVIEGEVTRTEAGGRGTFPNPDAARLDWIDVSSVSEIIVTGDTRGDGYAVWQWRFVDEYMDFVAISETDGNGVYPVPSGAKWASRTVKVSTDETDISLLKIYKRYTQGVATYLDRKINALQEQIDASRVALEAELQSIDVAKNVWRSGFVSPNDFEGATQTDRIKNAIAFIKKRGGGLLELSIDTIEDTTVWVITEAILIPSDCWIFINHATVKQADGVFDNWFRNDGIVPNPSDPNNVAIELNQNENIRIFGSGMDSAALEGPDVPYTAPHPINGGEPVPWVGDWYGWRAIPVLFANTKNYKVHDLFISKTTMWAISQEHGCEDFEQYNLLFDANVKNGDGVDVRQGCKNGKIHNIYGYTLDDTVALSAIGGAQTEWPVGNYIYSAQVGGYSDRGFGFNIDNVDVFDIEASGNNNGVRLLCSTNSKMTNINVDRISDGGTGNSGRYNNSVILVGTGYGTAASMGDMTNIYINNVKSDHSPRAATIGGPIQDGHINFVQQYRSDGVAFHETTLAEYLNVDITNTVEPV